MPYDTPPSTSEKRFSWPWLRERLFPRGMRMLNWTSYVILLTVLIIYVLDPQVPRDSSFTITIFALTALLVLNFVWHDLAGFFPTENISNGVFLIICAALMLLATWTGELFNTIYIIFMLTSQASLMFSLIPSLTYVLLVCGLWIGTLILLGNPPESLTSVYSGMLIGLTFTFTISKLVSRYAEQTHRANHLLEQLQAANAELLAARQKEKELAIAEERVRVARDLHDGLGHHLTALSIQLQAIEKLVRSSPDMAAEAAHNARSEVQAALKEVRQSVATLREAPVDIHHLPDAIAGLVNETTRRAGLRATFDQQGTPTELSAAAAMTLYRAAQEGLTNVQKHAQHATHIAVLLVYTHDEVRLSLQDDGHSAPDPASGGFGLAGLRERAHLLGGSLTSGPLPEGGFRIEISLPVHLVGEKP